MAPPLKNLLDEGMIHDLARALHEAHGKLDRKRFAADCLAGLHARALTERASHIADVMRAHLPASFARAADVLLASLGPELASSEAFGMSPLRYLPHVFFVSRYGLDDFEPSMKLQYELTKRFSAEFSIRAFLVHHPEKTYGRLQLWMRDANVHVRRLVSEGTRPRLPWAPRLRAFQRDPTPVLALLEHLKDDDERYVRRSVANNLNDIGKDHPDLLVDVCRRWQEGAGPERQWLVRHALRSLVKQGHASALALQGFAAAPRIRIEAVHIAPGRAKLGGTVAVSFDVVAASTRAQSLLLDYAVHYVKANGRTTTKVFKLRRLTLAPATRVPVALRISLADLTTRRHHPGRHRVEARINGRAFPLGHFDVTARGQADPKKSPRGGKPTG